MPRDFDFLFSANRFNVAVSRAEALAILVASPALLEVACRTAGQIRLANVLCRFVEEATTIIPYRAIRVARARTILSLPRRRRTIRRWLLASLHKLHVVTYVSNI